MPPSAPASSPSPPTVGSPGSVAARILGSTVARGLGVVAVAFVLRPPLAGVGPILDDIRADLALSGVAVSALTALPVLCLGAGAFLAPALARRLGLDGALTAALTLLTLGLAGRLVGGQPGLFTGTLVLGMAIAIGNVLLPAVVKEDFPTRVGLMTGVYSSALSGSAALAALLAVPLVHWVGHGWRGSLGVWSLVGAFALLLWAPQRLVPPAAAVVLSTPHPARRLFRSGLAWGVTLHFGLQSLGFYAVLTWLPSLLRDHGYSAAAAGALLSLATVIGIPVGLVLPGIAARARHQRAFVLAAAAATGVGMLGLLLAPGTATVVWVALVGLGQGSGFPLALLLVTLRSSSTAVTGQLSAMTQGFGYLLAAAGPLVVGAAHEATGGWGWPLAMLVAAAIGQAGAGWAGGRAGTVA